MVTRAHRREVKQFVAEFGVFRAARKGFQVMYTTPIKAANQKFRDLRAIWGGQKWVY